MIKTMQATDAHISNLSLDELERVSGGNSWLLLGARQASAIPMLPGISNSKQKKPAGVNRRDHLLSPQPSGVSRDPLAVALSGRRRCFNSARPSHWAAYDFSDCGFLLGGQPMKKAAIGGFRGDRRAAYRRAVLRRPRSRPASRSAHGPELRPTLR